MDANKFEFGNFCQVASRFMLEEDEEGMREELKEAFRSGILPSSRTKTPTHLFLVVPLGPKKKFFNAKLVRQLSSAPMHRWHIQFCVPHFRYYFLKLVILSDFRIYDKEGNGYITTDILKEILHEIDPELTGEDLDNIIEEVDEDGSGTLDFDGI